MAAYTDVATAKLSNGDHHRAATQPGTGSYANPILGSGMSAEIAPMLPQL